MCAMIQKLRMNFGSMYFGYRFRFATALVFSYRQEPHASRSRETSGCAKPCRMTVQFATNRRRAQPRGNELYSASIQGYIFAKAGGKAGPSKGREESSNDQAGTNVSSFAAGDTCSCARQKTDHAARSFVG